MPRRKRKGSRLGLVKPKKKKRVVVQTEEDSVVNDLTDGDTNEFEHSVAEQPRHSLATAVDVNNHQLEEEKNRFLDIPLARRMSMAYMYSQVDDAPDESTWDGPDGYICKLCNVLAIPRGSRSRMKGELKVIADHYKQGTEYDPRNRKGGPTKKITLGGLEAI